MTHSKHSVDGTSEDDGTQRCRPRRKPHRVRHGSIDSPQHGGVTTPTSRRPSKPAVVGAWVVSPNRAVYRERAHGPPRVHSNASDETHHRAPAWNLAQRPIEKVEQRECSQRSCWYRHLLGEPPPSGRTRPGPAVNRKPRGASPGAFVVLGQYSRGFARSGDRGGRLRSPELRTRSGRRIGSPRPDRALRS